MIRFAALAAVAALVCSAPVDAGMGRIERQLNGSKPVYIDPGPISISTTGTALVRFVPEEDIANLCPWVAGRKPRACTAGSVVTMPDPTGSSLSAVQWRELFKHELRHVNGGAWHGPQ